MRTEKLAPDKLALFKDETMLGYFVLRDGTWFLKTELELSLEEVKEIGRLKIIPTPYCIGEDLFFTNFNARHQPGVFKLCSFLRFEESSFGCTAVILRSNKGEYTKYATDTIQELETIMKGGDHETDLKSQQ